MSDGGSKYGAGFIIRMVVLLLLLGAVGFGLYYDRVVLGPQAKETIDKAFDLLNMSTDDGHGIPKDQVKKTIGFEPSEILTEGKYEVEKYAFRRALPIAEGQYINVIYEDGVLIHVLHNTPFDAKAMDKSSGNGIVAKQWTEDSLPMASIAGGGGGGQRRPRLPKDADSLNKFIEDNKDDSERLNSVAWAIVEKVMDGDEVDQDMITASRKAADLAVELEPESGAILDTQAHLAAIQGDLDEAIKIQTSAVEKATGQAKEPLEQYLDELMELKKKGSKPADKDADAPKEEDEAADDSDK